MQRKAPRVPIYLLALFARCRTNETGDAGRWDLGSLPSAHRNRCTIAGFADLAAGLLIGNSWFAFKYPTAKVGEISLLLAHGEQDTVLLQEVNA